MYNLKTIFFVTIFVNLLCTDTKSVLLKKIDVLFSSFLLKLTKLFKILTIVFGSVPIFSRYKLKCGSKYVIIV